MQFNAFLAPQAQTLKSQQQAIVDDINNSGPVGLAAGLEAIPEVVQEEGELSPAAEHSQVPLATRPTLPSAQRTRVQSAESVRRARIIAMPAEVAAAGCAARRRAKLAAQGEEEDEISIVEQRPLPTVYLPHTLTEDLDEEEEREIIQRSQQITKRKMPTRI